MAATWSWNTCELCGNGGKRLVGHTTGWIGSVCEECSKKIKRPIKFDMEIKKMLIKAVKQDLKQYVQG
jgi:ribosome-binding protein aMBF1 (putative translation factor)